MYIFNKERFQETLWLEVVGAIPEEAIQERIQWLHRQALDKSYSKHLSKKKLPDLLFVQRCQMKCGKWSTFQMETRIARSIPCYFNIGNDIASQIWKKSNCVTKSKRNIEKR